MKKILSIILTVCVLTMCFSACAPKKEKLLDKNNPLTINLWHYYSGSSATALEKLVNDFNADDGLENGIIVVPVSYGNVYDLTQALLASAEGLLSAGAMPDIFSAYPDYAADIDEFGMLCDLNEYFTDEEKNEYLGSFLEDGILPDGRFAIVPIAKSVEVLYVNNSEWQAFCAQNPYTDAHLQTWEGIYEISKAYYEWTSDPDVLWSGKPFMGLDNLANYVLSASKQLEIEIVAQNTGGGYVELNRGALRRLFDVYYKGYVLGYFNADGRFRADNVTGGELVAYTGASSGAYYFPTEIIVDGNSSAAELLALPYPAFESAENVCIRQGGGMAVANTEEANMLAASIFLKWLGKAARNTEFAIEGTYIPVMEQAYSSDTLPKEIERLRSSEDQHDQNAAKVYDVALNTAINGSTYSAPSFAGANRARDILQESLAQISNEGRQSVQAFKNNGLNENDIFALHSVDEQFEAWLLLITDNLNAANIKYIFS